MERIIRITEDGSPTLFVQEMDEPYHSLHGAIRESRHVFIRQGLLTMQESALRILEVGFGTGLNALLTLTESISLNKDIYYHAVEKYPLNRQEYRPLNYEKFIDQVPEGALDRGRGNAFIGSAFADPETKSWMDNVYIAHWKN